LTQDQDKAWRTIQEIMQAGKYDLPVLLHGVTGSGKTELYMRAIKKPCRPESRRW
jgi:primosomal protein N' (replication factor Y)